MRLIYSLAFTLLALFAAPSALANLIVNGSFEDPVVPANFYANYLGGSTAVTGWTVVGVDTSIVDGGFTQSGITFQAQDGEQWADMAGIMSNDPSSGLTQSIPTTIGDPYLLSFYVGSATGGGQFFPSTVDLSIDGNPRVPFFNPTGPANMLDWLQFSVPFVATGTSTSITFFNGSAPNNFLSGLDNVVVERAIPEPTSIALLLLGSAALAYGRYRRS
jgi:hypothetical protein